MNQILKRLNQLFLRDEAKNRISVIDGIKAISILGIVFYHIFWMLGDYMSIADLDQILLSPGMPVVLNKSSLVDMFFIIASFLSAIKLIKLFKFQKFNYAVYVYERIIRILPGFAAAIIFYILAGLANPESCWANLFYINIFLDFKNQCMYWSWYLAVQEQYILFIAPAIVILLYKFPRTAWWFLGITGILAVYFLRMQVIQLNNFSMPVPFHVIYNREMFSDFFTELYTMPQTRFLPLLFGSIIGWAYVSTDFFKFVSSVRLRWMIPVFIIFSAIFLPGLIFVSPHHGNWDFETSQINLSITRHITTIIFSLVMILLVSNNALVKPLVKILSARFWYPFSELSLMIYLYHIIIIDILYRIAEPKNPQWIELWIYYFLVVGITFILAVLTNIFVERSMQDWIYKLLKRQEVRVLPGK